MDNVKDFFSYNVPALISAFAIAAAASVSGTVVYAATVVGDNISTSGTLEVSGNSIFMANVGIGTTTPASNLHIYGSSGLSVNTSTGGGYIQIGDKNITNYGNQYAYMNFGGNAAGNDAWQIGKADNSTTVAPSKGFYIYDIKNSVSRMVIDTNGNVGIGTTTPGANLHVVYGGASLVGAIIENTDIGATARTDIRIPAAGTGLSSLNLRQGSGDGSADNMAYTIDYRGTTNHFRIRSNDIDGSSTDGNVIEIPDGTGNVIIPNGNVGIGTTEPGSKLSVVGLPSGSTRSAAGVSGNLAGAVCITDTGNMYIDTDGSCAGN